MGHLATGEYGFSGSMKTASGLPGLPVALETALPGSQKYGTQYQSHHVMKTVPSLLVGLVALLLGNFVAGSPIETAASPEQVEADWLKQDEKRLQPMAGGGGKINVQDDAAGGVDGIKNGQWGFHTEYEQKPWWQVDLRQPVEIGRILIYNRCDNYAERNSSLQVQISEDAQNFQTVYRNAGKVFNGFTDKKPLEVILAKVKARYVRLALPGQSYFHLDEVEIYPAGSQQNIALGKPATQSSTSLWSANHGAAPKAQMLPLAKLLERGLKLAESQNRLGHAMDESARALQTLADEVSQLPANAPEEAVKTLYLKIHWQIRRMAFSNPLLNFDSILFVKRAPTMFPHMSDQHYGWFARPGGGLYVLEGFKSGQPRVRCLTADFAPGSFIGPDISYDGRKTLFAYCKFHPQVAGMEKVDKSKFPADVFYNIYEINVDGTGLRRLTQGRYDDFDPRYLPNGDIMFLSTRKGLALQTTSDFSDSTRLADLPDSYVRCGGDSRRPVPVFTLHAMDAAGKNLRPLSAFENFEWSPSVAGDGRILYTRWDYIDRFNGHFFSLWSANQDGTNPQLVYGNYTMKPQVKFEARSIPGSQKLVITAGAHHSITGGSICLLDRTKGTEFDNPVTRLTPEVCFPETEGWPNHYYANPWPLSEEYFLLAWADRPMPPHALVTDSRNPVNAMGIYLYDAFGNQELLYRDASLSSMYPIPVASRPTPPIHPALAQWNATQEGRLLVQDVYQGLTGVPRGAIKQLRVIGVPPKVQPYMNNPVLGVSAEDPGKFVLGTVPVAADGSAYFRLPSGVPVLFQALDAQGLAVQTMRSLTYVMPNQTLGCVGCHEHRDLAPQNAKPVLAALGEPSRLTLGPSGSWPMRFDQLVQPVLDRHCVSCHGPGGSDAKAAKFDLAGAKAYQNLLSFGGEDLKKQAFERDRSLPGQMTAVNSKLWKMLASQPGHYGVSLGADDRNRLATWMDTYAHRVGHFSDQQERELVDLRDRLSALLERTKPAN